MKKGIFWFSTNFLNLAMFFRMNSRYKMSDIDTSAGSKGLGQFVTQETSPDLFGPDFSEDLMDRDKPMSGRDESANGKVVVSDTSRNGNMTFHMTEEQEEDAASTETPQQKTTGEQAEPGSSDKTGKRKSKEGTQNLPPLKARQDILGTETSEEEDDKNDTEYVPSPQKKSRQSVQEINPHALATIVVHKVLGNPSNLGEQPCKVFYGV